ncbi:MAG: arginine--tRNA ligase [Candidatus Pacebacteria bacterium]|nr:arginine--tRNA ligase [Candidatus Paceibacterota bacterium]
MEERIRKAVGEALSAAGAAGTVFTVERPTEAAHGDYTTNAALVAAKTLGKKPHEVADELARSLVDSLGASVSHIAVAGPGFVNIMLAREAITFAVAEADAQGSEWGKGTLSSGQRVMVEYTDPNPFKEMHIGHLMSNTIGEALSRLIESEGATIIRSCYSGDIGPHVAKALWSLRKQGVTDPVSATELSAAYVAGNRAYEDSPEAKAEIDALNTEVYKGEDKALMELWQKGREIALEAFRGIFKTLGTHFDYYFFESETSEPGMRIVRDGVNKGVFEESDGAIIYRGEKKGLHTLVFITSRGTPTYEAKDIGLAFLKEERVQTDRSIIMTGTEQVGHFKIVLAALSEIAPLLAKKTSHVPHGLLRLTTGKMSSREGNVITALELIKEMIAKASEKNSDPLIREQVAIGAIKYMVLRQAPGSDIIFDPEKSLSLEGDSGPYLQYALVRAKSVLEKATHDAQERNSPNHPYLLERVILHFPEVAARAAHELAPNLLVNYLTELAGEWNSFYAAERIVGGDYEAHKLMLARAFVNTMTNGLTLLSIPTPEKM